MLLNRWARIRVVIALLIGLVSCTVGIKTPNVQERPTSRVISPLPTRQPIETLIPSKSFALYVEMNDRYVGATNIPGHMTNRKGYLFAQRYYQFRQGEPITVTSAVLVLDAGELGLFDCMLHEFRARVVNQQGQEIPLTYEGRKAFYGTDARQCTMGLATDRSTPYIRTFRIDDLFDLSARERIH